MMGRPLLADGNKWAFFPSAAFAWRIKDEPFLSTVDVVSDAKLRLSYGEVGNTGASNGLVPLQSQSNIAQGFTNLGDQAVPTAFFANIPNDELSWERTREVNIGLDFGLFSNRIVGTLDVYNRKTSDLIQFRDLPDVSGFGGIWQNIGEVRNSGVELYLKGVPVNTGNFKWTVSMNFAKNKNELLSLNSNASEELFSVREAEMINRVGEELGSMYWFEAIGVWQTDELDEAQRFGQQPGQVKVRDQNDDGEINDLDRVVLGSQAPDWTGGLTNTLNYKNFDFTVFAYTRQGVMNYSWFHRSHGWDADDRPARFNGWDTNYWTPDNPTNDWHQPGNSGPHKRALFYQDVSFVKVGYITVGYAFPRAITESLKLGSLRMYATVQNPFVFTDYEGWDPENAGRNSWGAAHLTRSFIAGVNVRF